MLHKLLEVMRSFSRFCALLFLVLMVNCPTIAQNCDSVQFFTINQNLVRLMKEHYLLSSNKITVINFTAINNKFFVSITQDSYSEFARLFNVEFSTDSILGFFEYDNCQGILLGAITPLIKKEKVQNTPTWFIECISKKEHVFIKGSDPDIPLCFSGWPVIQNYLINRNARKVDFINYREMQVSEDYYVAPIY